MMPRQQPRVIATLATIWTVEAKLFDASREGTGASNDVIF